MTPTALLLTVLWAISSHRDSQSATELLENGIYAEDTQGDLDRAIRFYREVLTASHAERSIAAHALLRLGMCHFKSGRVGDAQAAFKRLASRYPEQKTILAQIPATTTQTTVSPERARRIGLFLSRVLRHDPAAAGVLLDAGGWVAIDRLLSGAALRDFPIEREEFDEVVRTSDKRRFTISQDCAYVRANYGHSVAVDLQLSPEGHANTTSSH
jgi:tetratricopeptide (TPR) repeat protein